MQWETVLFWAGTGVLFVTTAINQTDWKHRTLIGVLLTGGGACVFVAVLGALGFWPYVASLSPTLASAIVSIASSPVSWFSVLVLALSANLMIKGSEQASPSLFAMAKAKVTGKPLPDRPIPEPDSAKSVSPPRDPQSERDLLLLLDFAVYSTTLEMLTRLVDDIPAAYDVDIATPFPLEHANATAHHDAEIYMRSVRSRVCDGSDRASRYLGVIQSAEHDAVHELKQIPPENRPNGIDPLVLRDYAISYRQSVRTAAFLRYEKREIQDAVIGQRSTFIEQFRARNKS